jgi:hypothetical protein
MASCTQAEGRVLLGTQLQTLIWWNHDQQKQGLVLDAAGSNAAKMNEAAEMNSIIRCGRADKLPSVTVLRKFDPDDFDMHEDAFLNLLAQAFGVLKEPLHSIV